MNDSSERCVDCDECERIYSDPRDPPVDYGDCLCAHCYKNALEEQIDQYECLIVDLRRELDKTDVIRRTRVFVGYFSGDEIEYVEVRRRSYQKKCRHDFATRVDGVGGWACVCIRCGLSAR
jgi:hypothetical protein